MGYRAVAEIQKHARACIHGPEKSIIQSISTLELPSMFTPVC